MASKFQFNWKPNTIEDFQQGVVAPNQPLQMQPIGLRGSETWRTQYNMPQTQRAAYMDEYEAPSVNNDMQALMDEYKRNEARIAEIETEIASIEKAGATNLDDLDMALAANRAGIGDIGNSFAHTSRIQTRRQLADQAKRDKAINDRKEVEGIVEQLENAYIMRGGADNVQRADWDNKINRLSKKYKELTGSDYVYSGATPKTGVVLGTPTNLEEFDSWFNAQPKDKNGYYPKATLDKAKQILGTFTLTNDVTNKLKEIGNMKSAEKAGEDAEKQAKKNNEAIDNVFGNVTEWTLKAIGDSTTLTADNGVKVTATRTDGGILYQAGKQSKIDPRK